MRGLPIAAVLPGLVMLACASGQAERSPQEIFERMEQRLMLEDRIEFTVESTGAFEASFEGSIDQRGGEIALRAMGTWAGSPAAVSAETNGDSLVVTSPTERHDLDREPDVARSVIIGLSRMGVLHNLARLVTGRGPDHADGSVEEWVQARDLRWGRSHDSIEFDIFVNGRRAAVASVRIDPATGLPVERRQTVEFETGSMTVVETYGY